MKAVSQPKVCATISTGGAAYAVNTPPIDILTNSTPNVRYLKPSWPGRRKIVSRSIRAARVMAAGSVIRDPDSGTRPKVRKNTATEQIGSASCRERVGQYV